MKKLIRIVLFIFICTPHLLLAQLTVDDTRPIDSLVRKTLVGEGIDVSNVTFTGGDTFIGFFNSTSANVGLDSGIVMANNNISKAVGPNNSSGVATGTDEHFNAGDADLNAVLGTGFQTADIAILEFDFIPQGDSVEFRFVFASEEYPEPEFIANGFFDVFGFFISGPGISGTFSNGAINIANVPGTNDPISIETIRSDKNSSFYIDNGDGMTAPFNTDPFYIQYDGLTTVLTAKVGVQCLESYHIKLAIADGAPDSNADNQWDSAVFLEANSFNSSLLEIDPTFAFQNEDNSILEACGEVSLDLSRDGDVSLPKTVQIITSGTAIAQVDYAIPDSITFAAGQRDFVLDIQALYDEIPEGLEDVHVEFIIDNTGSGSSCTIIDTVSFDFNIADVPSLSLSLTDDQILACDETVETLVANVAGGYNDGPYNYIWSEGSNTASISVAPLMTTTYYVSVTDDCGGQQLVDSVMVEVPDAPDLTFSSTRTFPNGTDGIYEGCGTADVTFTRPSPFDEARTIYFTYQGAATNGTDYELLPDSVELAIGQASTTIQLITINDADIEGSEEVTIWAYEDPCRTGQSVAVTFQILDAPDFPISIAGPTQVSCNTNVVNLVASASGGIPGGTFTYTWQDGTLNDTLQVLPTQDTDYRVYVSDGCNIDSLDHSVSAYSEFEITRALTNNINDSTIYEGCGKAEFTFNRLENVASADTIFLTYTGVAADGVDHQTLPTQLIFAAGQASQVLAVNPIFEQLAEGIEDLLIRADNRSTCTNQTVEFTEVYFTDVPDISLTITEDTALYCPNQALPIEVSMTGGVEGAAYFGAWNDSDTNLTKLVNPAATTTYVYTVTDQCGFRNFSDSVIVTIPTTGLLSVGINTDRIISPEVQFRNTSTNATSFTWDFGDGTTSNEIEPLHTFPDRGNFTVQLLAENDTTGCTATATFEVRVPDFPDVFLPRAFTPNADGLNDTFQAKGLFVEDFQIIIFNRWGEIIYESQDINRSWDGTYKSKRLPNGTYIYKVNATIGNGSNSNPVERNGIVTLLR